MIWSFVLRLFLEGYLDAFLSVSLNLTDVHWGDINPSVKLNNIFMIILTVILLSLPIFVASFYTCHVSELSDPRFKSKYGAIYDGLWLHNKVPSKRMSALFYPFWFLARRLTLVLLCVHF